MIIQISSGQGPMECELAVRLLCEELCREYPDMEMISSHKSRRGNNYTSAMLATDEDLSGLEGSVQWICRSPYRPNHGRKNWFIDVSVIPEAEPVDMSDEVRVEAFHCGGHGGQNVNKVETGIRITHIPTGVTVTSTKERSQYMNKQDAMKKLGAVLRCMEAEREGRNRNEAWREHSRIVRGNPVRIYEGIDFRKKEAKDEPADNSYTE